MTVSRPRLTAKRVCHSRLDLRSNPITPLFQIIAAFGASAIAQIATSALLFFLFATSGIFAADSNSVRISDIKIVFLAEDAANGFDHSGCTANAVDSLKAYVRDEYPDNFVEYDLGKLLNAGIGPFYIYKSRYCKPIGELLGANTFVMTHVEISDSYKVCDDVYDVEVKVYSTLSGHEDVIFTAETGKKQAIQDAIAASKSELFSQILRVAGQDISAK